jgi:hypothetical protein
LSGARVLVEAPAEITQGWWSRAAAVVCRQALEDAVAALLERRRAVVDGVPLRAQLVVLPEVLDPDLASDAREAWVGLSAATHVQSYGLPPTADEMRQWIEVVARVVAAGRVS